jgi:hypothetical protein
MVAWYIACQRQAWRPAAPIRGLNAMITIVVFIRITSWDFRTLFLDERDYFIVFTTDNTMSNSVSSMTLLKIRLYGDSWPSGFWWKFSFVKNFAKMAVKRFLFFENKGRFSLFLKLFKIAEVMCNESWKNENHKNRGKLVKNKSFVLRRTAWNFACPKYCNTVLILKLELTYIYEISSGEWIFTSRTSDCWL